MLYRPSENKLKNARTKDYLGKAKLVAAADSREAYTTFTGVTRLQQGMTPSGAPLDRPDPDASPVLPLGRSATTSPRLESPDSAPKPVVSLSRNATTINVISREDRDGRVETPGDGGASPARANTIGNKSPVVTRGLSVRTPISATNPGVGRTMSSRLPPSGRSPGVKSPQETPERSSPQGSPKNVPSRLTEIYDDYIDRYANEAPPEVPPLPPLPGDGSNKRVAAWARNNANPATRRGPGGASTYGPPPSAYATSTFGGGSVRRKLSRRPTYGGRSTGSGGRGTSMYEEEEEGYVSGDYDDMPFELVKIRVKVCSPFVRFPVYSPDTFASQLHYRDDVRGMALTPETPFEEFLDRVTSKFGKGINGLGLKFKDEDGTHVSLRDDSDYDLAIETARESAKGKPEGKLEIWCSDQ